MKTKLIGDTEIYNKEKDLAIAIAEKFSGTITIIVTPYIDNRIKKNKEFFIDSIKLVLTQQITLYLSHNGDNTVFGEFDYSQMFDNDKTHSVLNKVRIFLQDNSVKLRN